ncbi:MAG: YfcC family protein, partial [Candidatus Aminicenantes bacterium]|nr:YfcC family protein [Candidatus Aminicenantes bacterium]
MKKVKLPHTLVLIYAMVVLTVIATWIVPGGEYERIEKDGRAIPVADSFHLVERQPQGIGSLFISPVKGFMEASYIIVFIFVVGGAFAVIQKTGAITAFIHNLALKFGESRALRTLLIPVTMVIFSLGGAIFGMCEETMPFVLIFVPLALSLGYDTIVGVSIPFVGAAAGFAGAFFNPFTVGIAQGIAGLPLYSGMGYRIIIWAAGTAMAVFIVMRYASRVLKDPKISLTYEEDLERKRNLDLNTAGQEEVKLSGAHKRVLVLFLLGMALLVFGILRYKWYINEIAGLFLALGILSGIVGRLRSEELARSFVDGAKDMINAALIIGCARAILVVAMDGKILDTTLYYMAKAISNFHPVISSQLMFICQCIINFFVHSG